MHDMSRILQALLVAALLQTILTPTADAQGIREDVIEALTSDAHSVHPCVFRDALQTLHDQVQAFAVPEYLGEEIVALDVRLQSTEEQCTQLVAIASAHSEEVETLLNTCRDLSTAEQACEFLDTCFPVKDIDPALSAYWNRAEQTCEP